MSHDFPHPSKTILVVGSLQTFTSSLLAYLRREGALRLICCRDAREAFAAVDDTYNAFDAVLIATSLPDMAGSRLCETLRQRRFGHPILLIAEQSRVADIVAGLDAGANDYLTAPVRPAELMARLRAQISAYERSEEAILTVGHFRFRPAIRQLQSLRDQHRITLTEKETAVLRFLCRAEGPVTRDTLLMEVWGYSGHSNSHTVETHIYRLRRKIEPDASRIRLLINENGGYRLRRELHVDMSDHEIIRVEVMAG